MAAADVLVPGTQPTQAQLEMAAFEKGRMQGELEAIRRMENETTLKQMPAGGVVEPAVVVPRADVVEINRLTWLQRGAAVLGESCLVAVVIMHICYAEIYRGGHGWNDGADGGNTRMWNTHMLCSLLGIFTLAQAILLYRVLPLNLNANVNRLNYLFWQACTITALIIAFVGRIWSQTDSDFWAADDWIFVAGFGIAMLHSLYSCTRTLIEGAVPVTYENWAEVNNNVTFQSAEQRRDKSLAANAHQGVRTLYTPAPVYVPTESSAVPPASANVGAEVPVAPANAPRWAENPSTHANDYFLMPRAKWGVLGFVGFSTAIIATIAVWEHLLAANNQFWSQGGPTWGGSNATGHIAESGRERAFLSTMGLLLFVGMLAIAYAALPPRTTLVKSGGAAIIDNNRRSSISHNAETRLGPNLV